MEIVSNKRAAENDEAIPVQSIAVCPSCSRISNDLKTCEHCCTLLSEGNSTSFYSSEPKRFRVGSAPLTAVEVSNMSSIESSVLEIVSSPSASTVRPETLFVNVNNQAVPVILGNTPIQRPVFSGPSQTVSSTLSTSGSLGNLRTRVSGSSPRLLAASGHPDTVATFNGNGLTNRTIVGTVNLSNRPILDSSIAVVGSNILGQQRLPVVPVSHTDAYFNRPIASSQITLPTYNLQPPPPPFASSIARLPVAVAGSSVPSVVPIMGSAPSQNVTVNAIQIRIGSRKFKPVSPVTFKDDGILFTLKDFTYAPVLLNARAIVRCKANLNTFSYPALFLFLENSCMRQIRQIFGLSVNEFAANNDVEIKRCISIFPVFGIEGKQQVQQLTFNIKRSFEAMVKRYPRSSAILEEITNDAVISFLLEAASGPETTNDKNDSAVSTASTAAANSTQLLTTAAASAASAVVNRTANSAGPMLLASTSSALTNGISPSVSERSVSGEGQAVSSNLANRVIAHGASVAASTSSASSAPVLVIPSDSNRWQMMQKNLVVGGVYHVLTPDRQRRYCLWNGTQLVPCMVQNTEVTLSCTKIRIGQLFVQCIGQVRIKADGASGVYFTMKHEKTGLQEIFLAAVDMSSLLVCIGHLSAIFIMLNSAGVEKLNSRLKPFIKDSIIEAATTEISKLYILIFLPEINHDQEEALKQMKLPCSGVGSSSCLNVIDHNRGLRILGSIQVNSSTSTAVNDYLIANKLSGTSGFDRLVQDFLGKETCNNDDDDDDVIMTQEELGIKCPYTQKVMEKPVRNIICNHNYEKVAIQEFILRKKGNAKCPYAGCGNAVPLKMDDLEDNVALKDYINKTSSKSTNQST